MREIKFRGKSKDDVGKIKKGDWLYGGIVFDNDRYWIDIPYYGNIIVDKDTIGQYTGLKDKNGKEIYEGDIVKFICRYVKFIGAIKYGKYMHSKCDEYSCEHYGYYVDTQWENYCKNTGFDLYEASKNNKFEVIRKHI